MPQQKQILIIDDLLTPQENFENSAEKANLNYEIVWDEKAATPHKVEVIVTVLKKLGKEYLQQFPNLKMIAVAFTGYDSVDMEYCKEHGIAIYNVPKYSTNSVVELAIGLTIAVLREITYGNKIIRNEQWSFKPGIELVGKTVCIMGTGEIGVATAKIFRGRCAPMNVIWMLACMAGVLLYWFVGAGFIPMDPAVQKVLVYVALCLIGFFIYGPVALTGVQALNLVPKNAAGTAAGFVGLFGYFIGDAICSKIFVGGVASAFDWNVANLTVAVGALIGVILCALLIRPEAKQIAENR